MRWETEALRGEVIGHTAGSVSTFGDHVPYRPAHKTGKGETQLAVPRIFLWNRLLGTPETHLNQQGPRTQAKSSQGKLCSFTHRDPECQVPAGWPWDHTDSPASVSPLVEEVSLRVYIFVRS